MPNEWQILGNNTVRTINRAVITRSICRPISYCRLLGVAKFGRASSNNVNFCSHLRRRRDVGARGGIPYRECSFCSSAGYVLSLSQARRALLYISRRIIFNAKLEDGSLSISPAIYIFKLLGGSRIGSSSGHLHDTLKGTW